MLLALLLPIVFGLLVGAAVGDIEIQKISCPPHTYRYMIGIDKEYLQCIYCNFIPRKFE